MTMIEAVSSFVGTTIALIFWELIKIFGVTWFKSEAPKFTIASLDWIDDRLPGLIAEGATGPEAVAQLRAYLGHMSDQEWKDLNADVTTRFDWTVFLNKHAQPQSEAAQQLSS
jgi:hypothetical protein